MAALDSGKRGPHVIIQDNLTFSFGGRVFGSPETDRPARRTCARPSSAPAATSTSTARPSEMGVDLIHDELEPSTSSRKTGIDDRRRGHPACCRPPSGKRRAYRKPEMQKWFAGETISLGIGQGYNSFTMLQMATAMSTLHRRPALLKPRWRDGGRGQRRAASSRQRRAAAAGPEARAGRRDPPRDERRVTLEARRAAVFVLARPTRAAARPAPTQAVGLRRRNFGNSVKADERKRDHSLYVAFAPVDETKWRWP